MTRSTPETDAFLRDLNDYSDIELRAMTEHARKLERERDELTALLAAEKATRNSIIEKGLQTERERDEAREALREAWLAMDEIDGTDRMVNWQNKHANILEGAK